MGSLERHELPTTGVTFRPYPATVGRIVHYTSHDTEAELKACRAAIVTVAEDNGRVGLRVHHPTGDESLLNVEKHDIVDKIEPGVSGRQPGTWHWPEPAGPR